MTAAGSRPVRVLLLCGGSSDEHQVSLASARSVLAAVGDDPRLELTTVVIGRDGTLIPPTESRRLLDEGAGTSVARPAAGGAPARGGASTGEDGRSQVEQGPSSDQLARPGGGLGGSLGVLAHEVDVVFPLLHGPNGEDGALQGLLRLLGLPFVGSGVLGSAVSMDKLSMKALFASAGLEQVEYRAVTRHAYLADPAGVVAGLEELGLPLFVKPANLGSSIGISKVDSERELPAAIETALAFDRRVIVEAAAVGARELELAVLGNDEPEVSGVGEIVFDTAFYDYDTKYTSGMASLLVPAEVPDDVVRRAKELALEAFACVDAAGLARVDLFYLPDGRLLVNELNTMPGFTEHSMYPRLWQAAGLAYPDLIDRLVRLALERR